MSAEIVERHCMGMTTQYQLEQAYQALCRDGRIDEDDLHHAVEKSIPKLARISNIYSFLCKVAYRRRRKRLGQEKRAVSLSSSLHLPAPQAPQSTREIYEVIDKLPGREQLVVHSRVSDDLSCDQIAVAMKCSLGAVRNVLFRARQRLRTSLL